MEFLLSTVAFLSITLVAIRIYESLRKSLSYYNYWKKQNIRFVSEGNYLWQWMTTKKQLHDVEMEWYKQHGNLYGRYEAGKPILSVGNTNLLEKILIKDFSMFANRRDLGFHDPIMNNTLFFLEGDEWRRVRKIVSPTFTASKLKRMLILLDECCDVLVDNLTEAHKASRVVHCQQLFESFVLGAIGRCAFGMNISSLKNPNNEFVAKSKKLFNECLGWRTVLTLYFPGLMKMFGLQLLNSETTSFYRQVIIQVLEERKNLNVVKDDFLQMILDAEDSNNNGHTGVCEVGDCKTSTASKAQEKKLSHDEMLAQCVTFFIAGFDPTTSLLSHVFYRLATHPQYQERVVEEIQEAAQRHNGNVCYEALSEMKFTDAMLNECLRLCPAMVRSERRAEGEYWLRDATQDVNVRVEKGMLISIPVYSMHHDPNIYPDPEEFKPERFYYPDQNRSKLCHLPFGAGPRTCIGTRFVQMQVKLCLAKVLLKFHILPSPTTQNTLKFIECRNILKVDNVDVCLQERCSS